MTAYVIENRRKHSRLWRPIIICCSQREAEREIEWFTQTTNAISYRVMPYVREV